MEAIENQIIPVDGRFRENIICKSLEVVKRRLS